MNKKQIKIAILTFVVLGITGIAIIKGKSIIDNYNAKKRAKNGKPKREGSLSKIFDLPEDLKS
jgi:hypothetical protein